MRRRSLLAGVVGAGSLAWAGAAPALGGTAKPRVLIIGAGWAGLSVAHALSHSAGGSAGAFDVQVIDRSPIFRSLPLSSPWLVGLTPERLPRVDLAALGQRQGWGFVAGEVLGIDRERRVVQTADARLAYDWLVLATGAACDHAAWFGGDEAAARTVRTRFPAGFSADELDACRRGLEAFAAGLDGSRSGTLVMTVPPPPYRCPPAPYERAALMAGWIRRRRLKARLVLVDAGGGMPRFNRLFAERFGAEIEHLTHSPVRAVDPHAGTLVSDQADLRFDHALLLPPMHAGPLAAQAGLLGHDAQGRPTRWAAVDPATLRSPRDERVYVVGDALDSVSALFGPYPKTAQIAAELGAAAAAHLAASALGQPPVAPTDLPSGRCHVWLDADPHEQVEIETRFRRRGDGEIVQTVRLHDNPQPRGEDLAWAREVLGRLGVD